MYFMATNILYKTELNITKENVIVKRYRFFDEYFKRGEYLKFRLARYRPLRNYSSTPQQCSHYK